MKKVKLPYSYKYIAAFLTMRCNLNCSFCLNAFDKAFDRRGFREISGDEWICGLNRIESKPGVPITLCGGEPGIHPDFIKIINGLKPELNIDILTNLKLGSGLERFMDSVKPERLRRDSKYASIRVSYHPEQMSDGQELAKDVKKMQDAGYSIGIWSVLYPSPEQLSAINQMQFICKDLGIDFRLKEFTGKYDGKVYGNYSKYPGACFNKTEGKRCKCRISELLLGPDAKVYRCHRDLYTEESPVGSLLDEGFQINPDFQDCNNYGECHPCDAKVKTDYKQQRGHTSVEIKDLTD